MKPFSSCYSVVFLFTVQQKDATFQPLLFSGVPPLKPNSVNHTTQMNTQLPHIHPITNFKPYSLSTKHPLIFFTHHQFPQIPNTPNFTYSPLHYNHKPLFKTLIKCTQNSDSNPLKWEKLLPKNIISAEKILRSIAGATSSPICQFISSPTTFLHSVDPRIKLVTFCYFQHVFVVLIYGFCYEVEC